jgi:hypothetical protein
MRIVDLPNDHAVPSIQPQLFGALVRDLSFSESTTRDRGLEVSLDLHDRTGLV